MAVYTAHRGRVTTKTSAARRLPCALHTVKITTPFPERPRIKISMYSTGMTEYDGVHSEYPEWSNSNT
ncbi:hypothetical protein EYF80_046057 [Liparis tanakae]|uniref:Uncharacterized protein n=1 Tax=Liparis tanakae TaxID=230148 RepID=A0A4Z2FRG5_9TELE|nr:hypothetical protein EYF80_046057 [Liparis tanakae]